MYPVVRKVALLGVVAVLGAACDEPTAPAPPGPRLGILQLEGYTESTKVNDPQRDSSVHWTVPPSAGVVVPDDILVVPDEANVGQPFDFTVTTIGESGCMQAESTEVNVDAASRTVELIPYDVHSGHEACTTILLSLQHPGTLTLGAPGEWTIRVTGRRARYGDKTYETPVSAEKLIRVH